MNPPNPGTPEIPPLNPSARPGTDAGRHDLRLSSWGPYTKRYIGVSHIADANEGLRFDLSLAPGFYRRGLTIPNVMFESGYHPWEAAPDLSYFRHRHQLEWKNRVYADISFSRIEESACLCRAELVNRSDSPQNLTLHYFASLHFPSATHDKTFTPLRPARPELPEDAVWHDAIDYTGIHFARPKPADALVPDGLLRGEVRGQEFTGNRGLGNGFGKEAGDTVRYRIRLPKGMANAVLLARYRNPGPRHALFRIRDGFTAELQLAPSDTFSVASVDAGYLDAGEHFLQLESAGNATVELDGFVVVEAARRDAVSFPVPERDPTPETIASAGQADFLLKYREVPHWYGVAWDFAPFLKREILNSELDTFLRLNIHDHIRSRLVGDERGHFANAFLGPVFLGPGKTRVIHGLVCRGAESEVRNNLLRFNDGSIDCERIHRNTRAGASTGPVNPAGRRHLPAQQRMAATTLTNVVFPIHCRGRYIRHYTPGRWWDCLYTWDSGFIGIGLLELDVERAVDCLRAYLTEPGDPHSTFIHHGTPVPVQIYLAQEIWNRTQDRKLLESLYPSLRQFHRFLAGDPPSTTRSFRSNLLATWDYFYNSGGWDDYPPQVHVHRNGLTGTVAPIANTAHAIRTARILRTFAAEGFAPAEHLREYDDDIDVFSRAILENAWDPDAAFFGYVVHDETGNPRDLLRHESGANYNRGLDGAYPLVAGICDPQQEAQLIAHLQSEERLWSQAGLSTVDRSAPYFNPGGYWNGAVWMPHQWFFWKALLDLGHGDLAFSIARRALDIWTNEVDRSCNCFEHFLVHSGRGAGWHQFGGLSCPVLHWFSAYHRPGRLTTGYDTWIASQTFSEKNTRLEADLKVGGRRSGTTNVLAVMNPDFNYSAVWNETQIPVASLIPGTIQTSLPRQDPAGRLVVRKLP